MTDQSPERPAGKAARVAARLKEHESFAVWVQLLCVIVALVMGMKQLKDATRAIESASDANRIALRGQASDLLVAINQAALERPELAGEFPGVKRLHLMRLHYLFRVHDLYTHGVFDDDRYQAETEYLCWCAAQPDFVAVWDVVRRQYPSAFRAWVDTAVEAKRVPLGRDPR